MIKLDKNTTLNTIAFYPEAEVTGSATGVRIYLTQEYDQSTDRVDAEILSKKSWVVAKLSGSNLPSNSGLYTLQMFSALFGDDVYWNTATANWNDAFYLWNDANTTIEFDLIATERAYVSGSNEVTNTIYSEGTPYSYKTYNQ